MIGCTSCVSFKGEVGIRLTPQKICLPGPTMQAGWRMSDPDPSRRFKVQARGSQVTTSNQDKYPPTGRPWSLVIAKSSQPSQRLQMHPSKVLVRVRHQREGKEMRFFFCWIWLKHSRLRLEQIVLCWIVTCHVRCLTSIVLIHLPSHIQRHQPGLDTIIAYSASGSGIRHDKDLQTIPSFGLWAEGVAVSEDSHTQGKRWYCIGQRAT